MIKEKSESSLGPCNPGHRLSLKYSSETPIPQRTDPLEPVSNPQEVPIAFVITFRKGLFCAVLLFKATVDKCHCGESGNSGC